MIRHCVGLMLTLVSGCYAAVPPPIDPGALPACSAGNYGVLGRDACESDADCMACGAGASCEARAFSAVASGCETGTCAVACCQHRCTVLVESPEF